MIVFYTRAYNAEKTIERTLKSVLNQTDKNWIWYVMDNGATDRTGDIIRSYASQDSRIIPLFNKQNNIFEKGNYLVDVLNNCGSEDYFCWLDADDEYKSDFLEIMTQFIVNENLDVAACGHDFINAESMALYGVRKLSSNLILSDPLGFDLRFPEYHQFMRMYWAKLYKVSLLLECNFKIPNISYGWDTMFVTEIFRNAKRIGILAQSLHKYYVSAKSVSHSFNNTRLLSDRILDNDIRAFLLDKSGEITQRNEAFLLYVYYSAIRDTLQVLLNSQCSTNEKLTLLQELFCEEKTQRLILWEGLDKERKQLFYKIGEYVLSLKECRQEEGSKYAVEILTAIYRHLLLIMSRDNLAYIISKMPEMVTYLIKKEYSHALKSLRSWYKKHHNADIPQLTEVELLLLSALQEPDESVFLLLKEVRKMRPNSAKLLDIDTQIIKLIHKYALLQDISIDLVFAFPRVIYWIIKENYRKALETFLSVHSIEISDKDEKTYILLARNLSAAAENADAYIYFEKLWISHLLNFLLLEEACKELDEFESLLPDDEDFKTLRKKAIELE